MGCILIAMPKIEDSNRISEMLVNNGVMMDVEICQTASEVLRISNDREFGVVICTKKLPDMGYFELSQYLPSFYGMIVITKDATLETFSGKTVKLLMPFKPRELLATVEMINSVFVKKIKKKKTVPIKRSNPEKEIVDKAKKLLMDRNAMTEPEAFRYIQKSSMDSGRSMVESAQMILMLNNDGRVFT